MAIEFRTPVNNSIAYIFGALVLSLAAVSIFVADFTLFAIGGLTVPIMLFFTHKYTRYHLQDEALVIRQFLQKTKRIPYRQIYKVRKVDNPRTMRWMHGQSLPSIEVYYNKFDMAAVLTDKHDQFFQELKTRTEQGGESLAKDEKNYGQST